MLQTPVLGVSRREMQVGLGECYGPNSCVAFSPSVANSSLFSLDLPGRPLGRRAVKPRSTAALPASLAEADLQGRQQLKTRAGMWESPYKAPLLPQPAAFVPALASSPEQLPPTCPGLWLGWKGSFCQEVPFAFCVSSFLSVPWKRGSGAMLEAESVR